MSRVIVVTGSTRGIGLGLARAFAAQGCRVVVNGRRPEAVGAALAALPVSDGLRPAGVAADIASRDDAARLWREAEALTGRVDVWINNAGRGMSIATQALTDDDFDEMMRVNVKSALYGMQTAVAHFQERGTGHVINVSSLLGRVPFATFRSAYCAAKHALNALTACLRVDVSRSHPGVHVSTVSPGVVATEFGVNAIGGGPDSRTMPGSQTAEEVAAVILDVIEHPRADAYTRPGAREMIAAYYAAEDVAELEKGWMAAPR